MNYAALIPLFPLIGFAIVRPDACGCADQLVNQPVVGRAVGNALAEAHHRFAEPRCSFLEVKRMLLRLGDWRVVQHGLAIRARLVSPS